VSRIDLIPSVLSTLNHNRRNNREFPSHHLPGRVCLSPPRNLFSSSRKLHPLFSGTAFQTTSVEAGVDDGKWSQDWSLRS